MDQLPHQQEEQRQAKYDARCAAAPHCNKCRRSVYPYDTYQQNGDFILCEDCAAGFETCYTEDLEV